MIINHNIQALNTYRQFGSANAATSKSMEKLSSGLRINRAGDDAAGLAISEKMRAQVRGLDQAAANAQDGISLIQTAEGALTETHSILQRMRELATKAANDTYTEADRGEIQKEINQLTSEINRIGNTTEFNTKKLLNGNLAIESKLTEVPDQTATGKYAIDQTFTITKDNPVKWDDKAGGNFDVKITGDGQTSITSLKWKDIAEAQYADSSKSNVAKITITKDGDNFKLDGSLKADGGTDELTITNKAFDYDVATKTYSFKGEGLNITFTADQVEDWKDGEKVEIDFTKTAEPSSINVDSDIVELEVANDEDGSPAVTNFAVKDSLLQDLGYVKVTHDATNKTLTVVLGKDDTAANVLQTYVYKEVAGDSDFKFDLSGVSFKIHTGKKDTSFEVDLENKEQTRLVKKGETKTEVTADNSLKLQIGANTGQSFSAEIGDMRSKALGISLTESGQKSVTIDGKNYTAKYVTNEVTNGTDNVKAEFALDVSNHDNATAAVHVINDAILKVSAQRSQLGAYQNRLEHTIGNLGASSENLTAAESRIRDVDMAKEIMTQTKNSILSQAAQAMLAQANQAPQNVLQLLR